MDKLAMLRNAGFACSLSHCACSQELADTLTEDQVHMLEATPSQSDNHESAAEFIGTLDDSQRPIARKIAEAVLGAEKVLVFIPRFDNDDDEAETPEQLQQNIARVAAEKRTRA
jgi:hypothetical protein